MDYLAPIAEFKDRLFHVHAKDAAINRAQAERVGILAQRLADAGIPGRGEVDWDAVLRGAADRPATTGPSASRWKTTPSERHSTADSGRCANRVARWRLLLATKTGAISHRGTESTEQARCALDWRRPRSRRCAGADARRQESRRITSDSCLRGSSPRARLRRGASRVPVDRANLGPCAPTMHGPVWLCLVLRVLCASVARQIGMKYTYDELAKMIDHSLLHPTMTDRELEAGCRLAAKYKVASVCIKPYAVKAAAKLLRARAWPSARSSASRTAAHHRSKRYETELACRDGATEIDMVINIGKALGGDWDYVEKDIRAVVREAHKRGAMVKVIFENDFTAGRRDQEEALPDLREGRRRLREDLHRLRLRQAAGRQLQLSGRHRARPDPDAQGRLARRCRSRPPAACATSTA